MSASSCLLAWGLIRDADAYPVFYAYAAGAADHVESQGTFTWNGSAWVRAE